MVIPLFPKATAPADKPVNDDGQAVPEQTDKADDQAVVPEQTAEIVGPELDDQAKTRQFLASSVVINDWAKTPEDAETFYREQWRALYGRDPE